MIPEKLYRGDSDKFGVRNLKTTLDYYQLQTNLLNGGKGHAIFTSPLLDLVCSHVDPGWATTHFLSFSEDKQTGLRFGLQCEYGQVDKLIENYGEYHENDAYWDFALITIDTRKISWTPMSRGVYSGIYEPQLLKFKKFSNTYKVILINVKEAIQAQPQHPNFTNVLSNAVRDKEWLILPTTETELNAGIVQYSGILDGACVSEIVKYKKVL